MSCYPGKHKRMAFKGMKFDTSALINDKGSLTGQGAGIVGSVINMAFGQDVKTDNRGFQTAKSNGTFAAKYGLNGAITGAKFGGVPGALVGAGVGSIVGLIKGNSANDKANRNNEMLTEKYSNNLISQGNSVFHQNMAKKSNSLYSRGGRMYPSRRMYSEGGVILGGNDHEQMGNSVVDKQGKTIAETEREELMLGSKESEMIDRFMEIVDQNPNEINFAQLGKLFSENILPNIKDNSGKFSLNKAHRSLLP